MRFGNLRGVTLAAGLLPALLLLAAGLCSTPALAQGFHAIPHEVEAIDLNNGGPYYAPPVPYGHYAKDPIGTASGHVHGILGKATGLFHHGAGKNACTQCGGKGCGACGGSGLAGNGGHAGLCGSCGGKGCGSCGGSGAGLCSDPSGKCGHGLGLFGKHKGNGTGCGLCGGSGCGSCLGHASTVVGPTAQSIPMSPVVASAQCGDPGCSGFGKHHHKGCGLCGGSGIFGGKGCGGCAVADPCGSCGGKGCGLCGGGHGGIGKCHGCGGKGCGMCGGRGLCHGCGGKGCGLCGLGKGLLGSAHGLVNKALHRGDIKWFVGPGGPVPLTPGYTPYINVTRSPRDFFAFPPMTP